MAVYVVTWNLNKEKSNYAAARSAFIKQLETYTNKADSGLESVRFISTNQSADQVDAHLRKKLDTNDRLLVSKMNNGEHQGWLSKDTWEWINARL
ncbi:MULTISPECIES: hypothetical protein [unclassified Ruegeria]|uniref:hypothetical protein n=1 Tax=unclassified Ruegeria TaxID=2625375 RepID=UPI0014885494|nr:MULTISPECIES: hypothetical protein [unclassified Ruegeria]NOD62070.1 hypothetical protein [Ruegeria sp. HKCCD6109]